MNSPIPIPGRIRLHITPFLPSLLQSYIPPSLLPDATQISYHTLQSFPEKNYGYIELPTMAAQKLKKKLNGSTLKGSKIRIEDARPEKRKAIEADEDEVIEEEKPKKKKTAKKAKRDEGEVGGVVLPEGRKVKRGWTDTVADKSKDRRDKKDRKEKGEKKEEKRKREISKYTTEPECLFRTELPASVTLAAADGKTAKKHRNSTKRAVIVHEFSNTTKHASFLKSGTVDKSAKVAHEFVQGKGWVDEDGNLIEEETEFQRAKRLRLEAMETKKTAAKEATLQLDTKPKKRKKAPIIEPESSSESVSSSDLSSGSESGSKSDSGSDAESVKSSLLDSPSKSAKPQGPETKSPKKEIHPLEALFKRPPPQISGQPSPSAKPPPIRTTFNFFAEDEQEPETTEISQVPKTPGTRQDLEWRSIRSPAPTPDTAAVNRKFSFSTALGRHEGEEEDVAMDVPPAQVDGSGIEGDKKAGGEEDESEFSKWFWENRGDNNRAWKKRRREAMKVRRKRENRRLTRRVV